jgi:hypothetical protein
MQPWLAALLANMVSCCSMAKDRLPLCHGGHVTKWFMFLLQLKHHAKPQSFQGSWARWDNPLNRLINVFLGKDPLTKPACGHVNGAIFSANGFIIIPKTMRCKVENESRQGYYQTENHASDKRCKIRIYNHYQSRTPSPPSSPNPYRNAHRGKNRPTHINQDTTIKMQVID